MIDPVDLVLGKYRVDSLVQFLRGFEVHSEGLLHHYATPTVLLDLIASPAEGVDGVGEEERGQGQVVETVGGAVWRLYIVEDTLQLPESVRGRNVAIAGMHPAGEFVPHLRRRREICFLPESLVKGGTKLVGGHVASGHADDLHLRAKAPLVVEVGEGGSELLGSEVARRSENHDGRRLFCHRRPVPSLFAAAADGMATELLPERGE